MTGRVVVGFMVRAHQVVDSDCGSGSGFDYILTVRNKKFCWGRPGVHGSFPLVFTTKKEALAVIGGSHGALPFDGRDPGAFPIFSWSEVLRS